MSQDPRRSFSREFKLEVIGRIEAGESVSALSYELRIKRELLYRWRDAYRAGGGLALRSKRGPPSRAEALEMAAARPSGGPGDELAAAQRRIAELERKVGQQQVDLDFFKGALRQIEESRRASDAPGATASSPRSKR